MIVKAGGSALAVVAVAALAGCGSNGTTTTTASGTTTGTTVSCRRVSPAVTRFFAGSMEAGGRLASAVYAFPSGNRYTPWVFAARIRGRGVALWVTDVKPTKSGIFGPPMIMSANSTAWIHSGFRTTPFGKFPRDYPNSPSMPRLDSPAFARAVACVTSAGAGP
jgi:hypothetical protein